jgi:hypothetical protein
MTLMNYGIAKAEEITQVYTRKVGSRDWAFVTMTSEQVVEASIERRTNLRNTPLYIQRDLSREVRQKMKQDRENGKPREQGSQAQRLQHQRPPSPLTLASGKLPQLQNGFTSQQQLPLFKTAIPQAQQYQPPRPTAPVYPNGGMIPGVYPNFNPTILPYPNFHPMGAHYPAFSGPPQHVNPGIGSHPPILNWVY